MASSKVMASSSSSSRANPDLPRDSTLSPSLSTLMADLQEPKNLNSAATAISMDDILKNIYADNPPTPDPTIFSKGVEDVWKDIVAGNGPVTGSACGVSATVVEQPVVEAKGEDNPSVTLEDFLSRSEVGQEDVRVVGGVNGSLILPQPQPQGQLVVAGGGRGKRRAVPEEPPVDKATQQKQRRMIKNRESAARSRERKQAYTAELESLVTQLEEENARLLREEAEQNRERFKQLVKNLIPVVEGRRPRRVLRRVNSNQW